MVRITINGFLSHSYKNITKPPQQLIDDYNWFLPETATKR